MDGILLVNKPKGITSRRVVNEVVRAIGVKKIGHTGTLDPLATGVLVLCVGKATKLAEKITAKDKEYVATVKFGFETDTLDTDGEVLKKQNDFNINREELLVVLNSFVGSYLQEVPKYSAVKINGRRLYEYARKGIDVELPKKEITIFEIELLDFNKREFKFRVLVSKGTYIRSLIRDVGLRLGVLMTMSDLIRTKQGEFSIEDCYTLEQIQNGEYKLLELDN